MNGLDGCHLWALSRSALTLHADVRQSVWGPGRPLPRPNPSHVPPRWYVTAPPLPSVTDVGESSCNVRQRAAYRCRNEKEVSR